MDDWRKDEAMALVREALAADPRIEKAQSGPRSTEIMVTQKDGKMFVLAMAVRDAV